MTAPLNLTFPQADAIIEQLTARVHQLIGTDYRDAAIDAASRAEAAADRIGSAETVEGWVASAEASAETASGAAATATSAVRVEVDKLIAGAPEAFDTLKEISDELEKNETERAALATTIGKKADTVYVDGQIRTSINALPLGGRNLFPDSSFERNTDYTAVQVPDAKSGKYVSRLDAGRWTGGGNRPLFHTGGEARNYGFTYWVRGVDLPVGYEGGANLAIRFKRYDGNREYLGEYYPPSSTYVHLRDLSSEWTKVTGVLEMTSTHTYLAPYLVLSGNSELEGSFVEVDDVFLADVTESLQITTLMEDMESHGHESADITDTVWIPGDESTGDKVIKTSPTGRVYYNRSATSWNEVTNKEYVDTEVAKKVDKDSLTKYSNGPGEGNKVMQLNGAGTFTISDSVISQDASIVNKRYVDSAVSDKATKSEVSKKADTSYVDQELSKKADSTYVDQELSKKADSTYVDQELGKKADSETVNKRPALFHGYGPPGVIEGAVPGDKYMDLDEMEIYVLPEENA